MIIVVCINLSSLWMKSGSGVSSGSNLGLGKMVTCILNTGTFGAYTSIHSKIDILLDH